VKFTKEGSIRLNIQPSLSNHINFMVSDTGIGIRSEDLPWLFNQFIMLSDRSLNPNGSGFGLYISNLLLESLGAEKMQVSSEFGRGSKFFFDLPITEKYDLSSLS
jgi:signal transduction histidine kinase